MNEALQGRFPVFCLPSSPSRWDSTIMPAMNGMPAHLIAQAARQHKADSHAEHQMNKVRHDCSLYECKVAHAAISTCVSVPQLEKWALDAEAHTLELAAANRQLRAALAHAQKVSQLLNNATAPAAATRWRPWNVPEVHAHLHSLQATA